MCLAQWNVFIKHTILFEAVSNAPLFVMMSWRRIRDMTSTHVLISGIHYKYCSSSALRIFHSLTCLLDTKEGIDGLLTGSKGGVAVCWMIRCEVCSCTTSLGRPISGGLHLSVSLRKKKEKKRETEFRRVCFLVATVAMHVKRLWPIQVCKSSLLSLP